MLLKSFQILNANKRKDYYLEVVKLLTPEKLNAYSNIAKEINKGNEHKVGVIRRVINTKIATSYTWEECMVAVNQNM